MKVRQLGNVKIIEFDTRKDAIAYAEASLAYKQLWLQIVEAEMQGLISQN